MGSDQPLDTLREPGLGVLQGRLLRRDSGRVGLAPFVPFDLIDDWTQSFFADKLIEKNFLDNPPKLVGPSSSASIASARIGTAKATS